MENVDYLKNCKRQRFLANFGAPGGKDYMSRTSEKFRIFLISADILQKCKMLFISKTIRDERFGANFEPHLTVRTTRTLKCFSKFGLPA